MKWFGKIRNLLPWLSQPSDTTRVFRLFHRGLGLVYLSAFIPMLLELPGLIGKNGLLSASKLLELTYDDQGVISSFMQFPSLFHLWPTDTMLQVLVISGILGGMLLLFNYRTFLGSLLSWISFLSITTIGGDFYIIIIDLFLAEVGFLAIFSTYFIQASGQIPRLVHLVFQVLNFRLWFCMGINKFYMPSDFWIDFVFFDYFFQAQPMPTPLAYYFHQTPQWLKHSAEICLFIGEVVIPFAVFGGKKMRWLSFLTFVTISVLIQLNGNYGYFNVLSVFLAFTILKDDDLNLKSKKSLSNSSDPSNKLPVLVYSVLGFHLVWQLAYSLFVFDPTPYSPQNHLNIMFNTWKSESRLQEVLYTPFKWVAYWRICNPYGVFRGIPRYHGEIRFSGSSDGKSWEDYEFKFLPSSNTDHLGFYAPYYPRLDHLMFYETLSESNCKHNPLNGYYTLENAWTCHFIHALFSNNKQVTELLRKNPFQDAAPKFIRTKVYRLSFDLESGNNWKGQEMNGFGHVYTSKKCHAPLVDYRSAMATVYGTDENLSE